LSFKETFFYPDSLLLAPSAALAWHGFSQC
jgi:hypothetical protein